MLVMAEALVAPMVLGLVWLAIVFSILDAAML
jgi:methyltransferase